MAKKVFPNFPKYLFTCRVKMIRHLVSLLIFTFVSISLPLCAEDVPKHTSDKEISFDLSPDGNQLENWNYSPLGVVPDDQIKMTDLSVRLHHEFGDLTDSPAISKNTPLNIEGENVQLNLYLKTKNVVGFVDVWLEEESMTGAVVEKYHVQRGYISGTNDWKAYTLKLPIHPDGVNLNFGVRLKGEGTAWVDKIQLLADGKSFFNAPKFQFKEKQIDIDSAFNNGSQIKIATLTNVQIQSLVMLGKVWGFLKYYHPQITRGNRHWDYDLFRIMPKVLASESVLDTQIILHKWVTDLGNIQECQNCSNYDSKDIQTTSPINWINNTVFLGPDLSTDLQRIYAQRPLLNQQFYVRLITNVGNPEFKNELPYWYIKFPDSGFQILSLFRYWNIIEYWSPYRSLINENWDNVLRQFLPKIATLKKSEDYQLLMMEFAAKIGDSHSKLWSSSNLIPPAGECRLPFNVRFVQGKAVISGFLDEKYLKQTRLQNGDVITAIDRISVDQLLRERAPFYSASNQASLLRDFSTLMVRGQCAKALIQTEGEKLGSKISRIPLNNNQIQQQFHDRNGAAFQRLKDGIYYMKLSNIKKSDIAGYIQLISGSKGLIIDLRNYPKEFVAYDLASHFIKEAVNYVRYSKADIRNPGNFYFSSPLLLKPEQPYYSGKIVVLVDEVTQSQAEYTVMALRAAPMTKVFGTQTAGADGDMSPFYLPGGIYTSISGLGIFYPDLRQTQRVGIIPDLIVNQTVSGLRSAKDEVLEAAITELEKN